MATNQLILALGVLGLLTWAGIRLLSPFAASLAQRLRRSDTPAVDDATVAALREELNAVHERVDVVERVIAAHRSASPSALRPSDGPRPQDRVPTPV